MTMTRLLTALTLACSLAGLSACNDKPATPATPPANNNTPTPANGTPTPPPAGTAPERGGEPPRTTTPAEPARPATPAAGDAMVGTWVVDVDKSRPEVEKFVAQMVAAAPEKPKPEEVKAQIDKMMEEMKKTSCEVKGDGTYSIVGGDGGDTGTWKREGDKYVFSSKDGSTTEGTLSGGTFALSVAELGFNFYFKKR